jgi:hypothetical protein
MGRLREKMESAFATVAFAERNMDGEARRLLRDDDEAEQPRKRADRLCAGQQRRKGMRAE